MSYEDSPQQDIETSDDQRNSNDGTNASRKGQPWTEEEHVAFLRGLRKLGKGNWRAIAKSFVPSRTATQVASHAQKHFMRVAGATKRKSRFTALEVQVVGPTEQAQLREPNQVAQENQQCLEQQREDGPKPSAFTGMSTTFPAMPFPIIPPMVVGFPGPFFAPFLCPPPAFAAAALSAMQKQQGQMPMVMPAMFPMAAAMAAINPFFMAQHMAAAAQVAAANAAAVMHAATSASGRAAGTSRMANSDTANSDEVPKRKQSVTPGSPTIFKPDALHACSGAGAVGTPAATASVPATEPVVAAEALMACGAGGSCLGSGTVESNPGNGPQGAGEPGGSRYEPVALKKPEYSGTASGSAISGPGGSAVVVRSDDCVRTFHTSSHSAFRPPQELKSES